MWLLTAPLGCKLQSVGCNLQDNTEVKQGGQNHEDEEPGAETGQDNFAAFGGQKDLNKASDFADDKGQYQANQGKEYDDVPDDKLAEGF